MSLMTEYINKRLSAQELEKELMALISKYNKKRDSFLLVFASAIGKPIPDIALSQEDYYMIADVLRNKENSSKIDIYLETPGGSGEAAEEIVNYLRSHFDGVSFVVSGEAKSAGTIMVLSGDEILMTKTGSLGPIDAQMKIGRSAMSAFDYIEWVNEKQKEAENKGKLNPFDAIMVAQISPGELKGVYHSLKFAEDLVVEWLKKYKFRNWKETETNKIQVTEEMKAQRAKEIVDELINHGKWRSHGRSIKIDDLESIKLKITRVDDDPVLKDIVCRIQTVCRLLFTTSSTYKIFATQDDKLLKQAVAMSAPLKIPSLPKLPDVVEINTKCPKCGKVHKIYAKFTHNPKIDEDYKKKGCIPFPKDNKLKCSCGYEINMSGIRNDLEVKIGKKVLE
ncbi:MAG: ATP-dependent Clp protease proteolytic subunit [Candidatus Omnitrophica bacterium]|nr:ATP-dependent Clp protease proteolytic subunit [Candidatus Omnitrophota bacterium]